MAAASPEDSVGVMRFGPIPIMSVFPGYMYSIQPASHILALRPTTASVDVVNGVVDSVADFKTSSRCSD